MNVVARFKIFYADGQSAEYGSVTELTYVGDHGMVVASGSEELKKHPVPIGLPFWLRTADGVIGINGDGVRIIEVIAD